VIKALLGYHVACFHEVLYNWPFIVYGTKFAVLEEFSTCLTKTIFEKMESRNWPMVGGEMPYRTG